MSVKLSLLNINELTRFELNSKYTSRSNDKHDLIVIINKRQLKQKN